jgi:PAS domain S-box-containing protein
MDLGILEFLPDGIIVTGADEAIRYVNRAAERLFGFERAELLGKGLDVLVPSRFRAVHRLHTQEYFSAPQVRPMGIGLELVGLRKDGSEVPIEISLAPYQAGGERLSIACVRDVTERKAYEERERRLRKAEDEIKERDAILTIASHELRAPVGSLQLQVGMLQRVATSTANDVGTVRDAMGKTASELDAMRQRMAKIERHARRLAQLIDQLLDASHIRVGKFPLRLESTDLADLTRETVGSLRDEVEGSGSTLTLETGQPVLGEWDPIRVEQVIANLLLNAAKFGRGNPIIVSVEGDPERGWVSIKDEGIGIGDEDRERIFLPFERAVAVGGVMGLGLGLYIARQIVSAHGGTLTVESVPGVGSTFRVELPRRPGAHDGEEPADPSA